MIAALAARIRQPQTAPLIVAGLISPTLFFAALMAASLAVDRPTVHVEWVTPAGEVRHPSGANSALAFGEPTHATEAKIWLLALAVIAIVLLAGSIGALLPHGVVLPALAGMVVPWLLLIRLDEWTAHHAERFPYGNDLVGKGSLLDPGQWEEQARGTVRELVWASAGIATVALAGYAISRVRRRRARAAAA